VKQIFIGFPRGGRLLILTPRKGAFFYRYNLSGLRLSGAMESEEQGCRKDKEFAV